MKYRIPLSEPTIGQEEEKAIRSVLASQWLTMGEITNEFENIFLNKLGIKHAYAVSNCTAALHLACLSIGLKKGDEVLCPVLSFVATANAIEYTGARAVFINPTSTSDLTIDTNEIESRINSRTKAIMVMHYGGYASDMENIISIARKYKLRIIEDCAHSLLGKNVDGTYLGTKGDVACFSFYGNKNMTTGEGGMVITNDDKLADRIKLFRSHGMTTLSFDRYKGHASEYDVKLLGYNYRLDDIRSSIGIEQFRKVKSFNEKRRNLVRKYYDLLSNQEDFLIPFQSRTLSDSACHLMVIITMKNPIGLRKHLSNVGIQTSRHYRFISEFEYYKNHEFARTSDLFDNIVTLPLFPKMTHLDVETVSSRILEYYG